MGQHASLRMLARHDTSSLNQWVTRETSPALRYRGKNGHECQSCQRRVRTANRHGTNVFSCTSGSHQIANSYLICCSLRPTEQSSRRCIRFGIHWRQSAHWRWLPRARHTRSSQIDTNANTAVSSMSAQYTKTNVFMLNRDDAWFASSLPPATRCGLDGAHGLIKSTTSTRFDTSMRLFWLDSPSVDDSRPQAEAPFSPQTGRRLS
jgi:hypothetical protein